MQVQLNIIGNKEQDTEKNFFIVEGLTTYLLVDNDYGAHDGQIEQEARDGACEEVVRRADYHIVLELIAAPAQARPRLELSL